jgi:hypothetical protein
MRAGTYVQLTHFKNSYHLLLSFICPNWLKFFNLWQAILLIHVPTRFRSFIIEGSSYLSNNSHLYVIVSIYGGCSGVDVGGWLAQIRPGGPRTWRPCTMPWLQLEREDANVRACMTQVNSRLARCVCLGKSAVGGGHQLLYTSTGDMPQVNSLSRCVDCEF